MSSVTGTVVSITGDKKRSVKITTDEGKPRTVGFWKRINDGNDWVDNPLGKAVKEGVYGTFEGEYEEWTTNDGEKRKSFLVANFIPKVQSPNGTAIRTGGGYIHEDKDASFALSYAKDIVTHLVDIGALKDEQEIETMWLALAEAGHLWLKQASAPPEAPSVPVEAGSARSEGNVPE